MSFAKTAAHFADRAKKTTNEDEQKRYLDAARYYKALADIIPDFPRGYVPSKISHAGRWQACAEECRTIADCLHDPVRRERLLQLAETYDKMDRAEK